MSNRNFDASVITQRKANKAVSKNILSVFGSPYNFQPQTSNLSASVINEVALGNSQFVTRGPTCTTTDLGCPCIGEAFVGQLRIKGTNAQWATFLDGSGGTDIGHSIGIDSLNNIYVTGVYRSSTTTFVKNAFGNTQINSSITLPAVTTDAVFLIKYDSSGQAQWATYLNGTLPDIAYSLAIDNSDNIYITGEYNTTSTIFLQDASGNTQTPSLISLPSTFITTANTAVFIMKYNSSGKALWATLFNGVDTSLVADEGRSIIVDLSNNIYITGGYQAANVITLRDVSGNTQSLSSITLPVTTISGTTTRAAFLVKYNSSGRVLWATFFNAINTDVGLGIDVDSSNNVYITGSYITNLATNLQDASGNTQSISSIFLQGVSNTFSSAFLMKYNSNGRAQWATYLRGTSTTIGSSIAIDLSNNIYITGTYTSQPSQAIVRNVLGNSQTPSTITLQAADAVFLIKYNSNGLAQWATTINGTGTDQGIYVLIGNSNIYITGSYTSTSPVILQDASGNTQVASQVTLSPSTTSAAYLAKYNFNGIAQWATYLNGTSTTVGRGITNDTSSNLYLTGQYNSTSLVTVQNAYENSQIASSVTLGATTIAGNTTTAMFLIKYTEL